MKWSYDLGVLRQVNKQLNIYQQVFAYFQNTPITNMEQTVSEEDQEILKNVFFELYLIQKQPIAKVIKQPHEKIQVQSLRRLIKPFRTISAIDLLSSNKLTRSFRDSESRMKEFITFEYNLTNLSPETKYVLEVSARLFHLESKLTNTLSVVTLRECFFSIYLIFLFCLLIFVLIYFCCCLKSS